MKSRARTVILSRCRVEATQFVLLTPVTPQGLSTIADATTAPSPQPNEILLQRHSIRTTVITEEKEELGPPASRRAWVMLGASALLILIVLAIAGYVVHRRSARRLTAKDTVVLADFANRTGDPVFDDTLKTALSVALNQSPFLDVLSDRRVAAILKMMSQPAGAKLTPEVVRDVCQRAGSKAYISGSIATLGSQYVLAVEAVSCQSGDTLAQEQATASAKERLSTVEFGSSQAARRVEAISSCKVPRSSMFRSIRLLLPRLMR